MKLHLLMPTRIMQLPKHRLQFPPQGGGEGQLMTFAWVAVFTICDTWWCIIQAKPHTHTHTHEAVKNFGQPIYNFDFRAHFRGCLCRGRALQVLAWGVAKLKTVHTHTLNMPQLGSCDRVRCLSLLPCRRSKNIFESFESSHSWNDVAVVAVVVSVPLQKAANRYEEILRSARK